MIAPKKPHTVLRNPDAGTHALVQAKARREKIRKEQHGAFMKFDFQKFDYDDAN